MVDKTYFYHLNDHKIKNIVLHLKDKMGEVDNIDTNVLEEIIHINH